MSDFKQKVGCCFFLFAKNGHFHDSKAIFWSKSENFKFASNWPILTKIAKIKGKMAFLWNFKQTLLNQMGVDKPIFGNFRGQKHDFAKINWPSIIKTQLQETQWTKWRQVIQCRKVLKLGMKNFSKLAEKLYTGSHWRD